MIKSISLLFNDCLFLIHHEQLVLWLVIIFGCLFLFVNVLFIGLLLVLWFLNLLILLTQEPLLTCQLFFSFFLSDFLMFQLKLFLPCQKVLWSNRCKGSELWSLKYLLDFFLNLKISFISSPLNQEVNNPQSNFFNNIIDNRFIPILIDNILNKFGNLTNIIPGDTSHRFDLILDRSFRIGFSILEMYIKLILVLMFG